MAIFDILILSHNRRSDYYKEEKVLAKDFIMMILRHLLPENFKIIRYYGFYRNKKKIKLNIFLKRIISDFTAKQLKKVMNHECMILNAFGRNPYKCDKCYVRLKLLISIC